MITSRIRVTPEDDLQAILDRAPENTMICLAPGVYRQKLMLRTPRLSLVGESADSTVIVYGDYARKAHPVGGEYNTFRTYTVAVCADGVTMRNISVVNDALYPERKGQEVALSVLGTEFYMENCTLRSTQDTLFAGPLPDDLVGRYEGFLEDPLRRAIPMTQHFVNCRIEGTVDFIFGCAMAVFEDCEIRSLADARGIGYVAAPAHSLRQNEGFRFLRCRLSCEEGVPPGSIYLARPWRDYGMVSFENCVLGPHIHPQGFDKWDGTRRDLTARFHEFPPVPGRVCWINRNSPKDTGSTL